MGNVSGWPTTSLGNYANTIVLKEKLFVPGAYRHKIRTGLCIIVSPQSDGATVMSFGVVTHHRTIYLVNTTFLAQVPFPSAKSPTTYTPEAISFPFSSLPSQATT